MATLAVRRQSLTALNRCAKDFQPDRGLNQAPPKGNGLPWTKFEQMEWIDPDMQTSAPNCKPVVYWVRCKSNQCKKPFSCIRTDIMVRLPNDNYVNDIKFVCKKSMTNALDVKKDDGKSKK